MTNHISEDKLVVHKSVAFSKNYLLMSKEELMTHGIKGCRLSLAMTLRSKLFDILSIIMIAFYSALIFIYIAFED